MDVFVCQCVCCPHSCIYMLCMFSACEYLFVSKKQWLSMLPEALIEAAIKGVNEFV